MDELKAFIAQQNQILKDSLTTQINDLKELVSKSAGKVKQLEQEIEYLKTENKKLERDSKANNILVFNSDYRGGNLLNYTLELLNTNLDLNLTDADVDNIYTIGNSEENKPIVLKFVRFITKLEVLKNSRKLKGKNLSIVEDLSKEERSERKILVNHLREARRNNKKAHIFRNKLYIDSKGFTYSELLELQEQDCEEVFSEDLSNTPSAEKDPTNVTTTSHSQKRTTSSPADPTREESTKKQNIQAGPETKTTKCYKCPYEKSDKSDLETHLKTHLPKVQKGYREGHAKYYKCPKKNCIFISRFDTYIITAHEKTHVKKFDCPICNEICDSIAIYRRHIQLDHTEGNSYKCGACPFLTENWHKFQRHIARHRDQQLKCHSCPYKTKYRENLLQHLQEKHKRNETYYCYNCSYSTRIKQCLKIHVLVHMNTSRLVLYKCDKCDFSTKYATSFQKHGKRLHSGKSVIYTCNFCQDTFKVLRDRRMHVLQFHGQDDEVRRKYIKQCPECGYETYRVGHMKLHMQKKHGIHRGPKKEVKNERS
ncbi:unnamed protein product [Phaedon cochleariae]|uniref:C2H2-type domain-containing protein n=1 Tax=Phaedon cochleariae TaxID=80249 RepID=A0A9N9SE09_PHACE|nr:unnamed protein product [Phaedon cochleariae]